MARRLIPIVAALGIAAAGVAGDIFRRSGGAARPNPGPGPPKEGSGEGEDAGKRGIFADFRISVGEIVRQYTMADRTAAKAQGGLDG